MDQNKNRAVCNITAFWSHCDIAELATEKGKYLISDPVTVTC